MDSVYLTKIVSLLVYPLGLFVLCHGLALLLRGAGRRGLAGFCLIIAWLTLLMSSNPLIAEVLLKSLEKRHPQQAMTEIERHDAILVLGGGLRIPLPPAKATQLSSGSDRYWHAAQLFKSGKASLIVIAGGNVFQQPGFKGEAHYAAELLQEWGVPADAIKIETASRNTQQNVSNVSTWLRNQGINEILLVTSAYHMPRALLSFDRSSIKVTPASADIFIRESSKPVLLDWLPSVGALGLSTMALHEYYGIAFIHLKRWLSGA